MEQQVGPHPETWLEKGAWSPGHPRVALSGAVGAAPGSVRLQTSAGSRCSLCPQGDWPLHHAWSLRAAWELRRPSEGSQAAERGPARVPQQSRLRVTAVLTLVNVTIAVCSCASLRLPLPPCPPTPAHPGSRLTSAHLSAQPHPPGCRPVWPSSQGPPSPLDWGARPSVHGAWSHSRRPHSTRLVPETALMVLAARAAAGTVVGAAGVQVLSTSLPSLPARRPPTGVGVAARAPSPFGGRGRG